MANNKYGVLMYGPQRWAAVKRANAQQLGWSWGDIGSGIANIGKSALNIFTASQQTETYKSLAEQQAAERAALVNTAFKAVAVISAILVVGNALKRA